ncbi:MAG: class I SAM-dependent methyltransferase [Methanomassiliicoccales archaeon]
MKQMEANRRRWDELAERHLHSTSYPIEAVISGLSTLRPIELEAFGDVTGKRLLHLQCHIGLDSISWARRGAEVVGIDFSAASIKAAKALAHDCGVEVEFVQGDVMDLECCLEGGFDRVAATYGVACWIPDLLKYFANAAAQLKPEGKFLVIDDHPFTEVLDQDTGTISDQLSYFQEGPVNHCDERSYAQGTDQLSNRDNWQWPHRMEEFLNASSASFEDIALREYPFSHYRKMRTLSLAEDGYWHSERNRMPLLMSVLANDPISIR